MTKYEQLGKLIEKNNGYLFASDVANADISRTYLARYVKENSLEKVAKGIYISADTFEDSLFIIQHSNPIVIYSGETALYLNGLLEREDSQTCVSVPSGHYNFRLKDRGLIVHQENSQIYGMGAIDIATNFGNMVKAYNKERSICYCIKNRSKYEVQTYQAAIKNYMRSKDKDLSLLAEYADVLNIRDEVMKYVEVMI